jgi:two-component sensor histidine kinase
MKPTIALLLCSFLLIQPLIVAAQSAESYCRSLIDTLEKTTINKENEASVIHTLAELKKGSVSVEKRDWYEGKLWQLTGQFHYYKNEFASATTDYKTAEIIFKKQGSNPDLAFTYVLQANLLDKQSDPKQAMTHYLKAIRLLETSTTPNYTYLAIAHRGLGVVFGRVDEFDKSLFYKKKAFEFARQLPPAQALSYYTSLANTYGYRYEKTRHQADVDSAYRIAAQGYLIAKSTGNLKQQAQLLSLITLYKLAKRTYAEAGQLADQQLTIGRRIDETILMTGLNDKVAALIGLRQFVKARQWSDSLLFYAQKKTNSFYGYYLQKGVQQRYELHKQAGNYGLAVGYAERLMQLKDSLSQSEKTVAISELEKKYETEKKQKAIELLTAQNQAVEAKIKQRTYLLMAVAAAALLVVGYAFFVIRQRTLNQRKEAAELKQRLLRAQLNPHFLFNSLNSVQRLYVEGRTAQANDFIADFAQLMRDILEKTGRTHIPLYEEIDFIEAYLSLEKRRLGDTFDYRIVMDEQVRNSDAEVPSFIIQPLAENALLHGVLPRVGQRGQIDIIVEQQPDETLSITVQDNGVGYYQSMQRADKHTSRGMELIRQRLGKRGQLLIEELRNLNQEVLGTRIRLQLSDK